MYTNVFKGLVEKACFESDKFYEKRDNAIIPNPFYIGFGNPNSKILIVGQEKAINQNYLDLIEAESKQNPYHWKKLINNEISDINYLFYNSINKFKNPLHPYNNPPKRGNTWGYYQRLLNLIYSNLKNDSTNNSFFKKAFITEVNHDTSNRQIGNQKNSLRNTITSHPFYKSFNVSIVAAGGYLSIAEIEDKFDVELSEDISEPRKRLIIFLNKKQNRIVINTRQLSQDVSGDYLERIVEIVKKYV